MVDSSEREDKSQVVRVNNDDDGTDSEAAEMMKKVPSISNLAQNLFGRLLGIVGDKFVKTHPHSHFESSVHIKKNDKLNLNIKNSKEQPDNMSQSIFGLFDSLSEIPAALDGRIDGPHVCVRELNVHLERTNGTYNITKRCQWFSQAQRCISRRQTPEESLETTRIQECCGGYETDDIMKGCSKKVTLKSLEEVMTKYNISTSDIDDKAEMKTYIINPNSGKALVIDGIKSDYEMRPEDDLSTVNGQLLLVSQPTHNTPVQTYINCVRLNNVNVRLQNNLLHIANDDIKPASENLLNLLETDGRFTQFSKLLSNTSKVLLSSNDAELTVLAFTDDVFAKLPERLQQQISLKKACVDDIDRSHILRSSRCAHQLEEAVLIALTGQMYHLEKADGLLRIGNARIIESNLVAKNGIVHVVDNLLMKEDLIPWEENLKRYHPDLSESLQPLISNMDEPITIFVPPQKNESESLDNVLSNVVIGKLISLTGNSPFAVNTASNSSIFAGRFQSTSALSIRLSAGHYSSATPPFQIGCSKITRTSVFSCNSVLHFVDKEIDSPTQTIDEFLNSRDNLKLFHDLYSSSEESKYDHSKHIRTVFAPSNDAFSKNGYRRLQQSSSSVETFIRRHTVERPLCDDDMRHKKNEIRVEIISNRNGEGLRVQPRSGDLYVEEAKIEEYHVLSDGIVYVVDSSINKSEQRYQPDSSMRSATDLLNIFH
ncbi:unnamed protein product [Auanema sp. JU1783]|nr:unnamed protein product [Auanema sp. JU1783]